MKFLSDSEDHVLMAVWLTILIFLVVFIVEPLSSLALLANSQRVTFFLNKVKVHIISNTI